MKKNLLLLMLMSLLCGTAVAQTKEATAAARRLSAQVAAGNKLSAFATTQATGKEEKSTRRYATEKDQQIAGILNLAKGRKSIPATSMKRVGVTSRRALPDTVRRFKWTATASLPVRSAVKRAAKAAELKPDYYFSKDSSRYNGYVSAAMKLISQDGALKMTGVFGLADTVAISFNATSGTVSIAPQKIAYSNNYKSDVYIYAIDPATNKYSTTAPITGTVDEGGAIRLGPWGVFVAEGESKGGIFDAYTHSVWMPSNATITNTNEKGVDTTFAACVEQTFDNELVIYNMAANGTALTATLTPQKQVKVSSQYIFTNSFYGDFFCFPVDWDKKQIDTKSPIVGTGTSNTITLGGWVVSARSMPASAVAMAFTKTVITTTTTLRYPKEVTAGFEGDGTPASPYLIKTAHDFYTLSQVVAAGESYGGKYFRVENDIDFAGQGERYQPIGTLDTPFNGVFDGNHHTLSNLTLEGKGNFYYGLFGATDSTSIVKNVVLSNASYTGSGQYCGLLVGQAYGSVEGCTVEGTVKSTGVIVGGVMGVSRKSVTNTTFKGSVSGYGSIGGIAGNSYGEMANCSAEATIDINGYLNTLDTDGGGLVGEVFSLADTKASMTDCYFSGTVSDTRGLAFSGGLAGLAARVTINRCFNVGYIQSTNNSTDGSDTGSGGLLGVATDCSLSNCYNAGSVVRTGQNKSEGAGGLVGYLMVIYTSDPATPIEGLCSFNACYNSGMVKSSSNSVDKGLYGRTYILDGGKNPAPAMFTNCFFDSQMTGLRHDTWGKPTSFFTSGTLPSNFDAGIWQASKDAYPLLKDLAGNHAAYLSAAAVSLADGETASKVKTAFTLHAPQGITWQLFDGEKFTGETPGLKISGSTVTIKDVYSTELLAALSPEGDVRMYTLAVVPKAFEGDGTAASPYLLKTKADFVKLDEALRLHQQPHEGDYFALANDIDFAYADDFSGVGVGGATPFAGTFDGRGHYVHKLKIHSAMTGDDGAIDANKSYYAGSLFNTASATSVIKNVRMAADCDFFFWGESGAVVGYTEGRVDSCRNYAPVKGVSMYVGGVVGVAGPTAVVNACYNAAPVTNGRLGAGGIVGYNRGSVSLCQNDGDIKAAFVNDFVADGSQKIAGGIVGENYGAVASCVNNGTVSAYQQLGGIVGLQSNFYSTASLTGNVNNGLVTEFEQGMSRGGVAGEASGGIGKAENNYYDASVNVNGGAMNAATAGVSGLSSSKLTSGDALAGLDAKVFNFAKAAYPVLSLFKDEPAAKALRSIYVGFQDGDKRTNVVKNVAVSSADGLKWTLVGGPEFTLEGDTLVVAPPTEMKMANDTLTAQTAEGYSKVFYLTSIPQNLFVGKGTQDDPYLLQTAEDLQKLSSFIAASKMEYDGYFFKVANDIDCQNDTLRPIAYGGVNFQGSLDGNGKTIKGYVFDNENWRVSENGGFFGSVGASGVIHDLTLAGKFHGYANVGGFTSKLYGTLRRCTFKGTVSAKNAGVGGFAYEAYPGSVIDQCVNEGTVFSATRGYVGGVVSQMDKNAVMTSCVNKGTVSAASLYLGGLAATCRGTIRDSHNESPLETTYGHFGGVVANVRDSAVIENCYNQANLTGAGNMGGVIGSGGDKFTGIIKNCYNSGKISGRGTIGGFAGDLGTGYTIEDCYNTGDVESSKSTDNGGFVGKIDADEDYPSFIVRCYNTGDVKATDNTTGGFAGTLYDESVTAEDCYNTGNVSVTSSEEALGIGGFAGDLSGKALRCWNAGNVEANGYGIGGMGGYSWGVVDSCFNVGNITSVGTGSDSYGRAGGIWGYGKAQISNCYNMGTITGSAMIAGINGMCFSESKVENCYNAGLIVVTGDDKTAYANIANIYGEDLEESVVSNNYYDEEVNAGSASDKLSGAKGLTSAALFDADLGDAFTHTRAAYPTLTALAGNVWAEFAAASVAFTGEGDNRNHVTRQFYVAKFDNVEWTASDNLRLADDGTVETTATGKAWLKATAQAGDETLEKTIDLEVLQITDGIGTLTDGKTVAKRRFFELGGVEVKHPVSGTVYIITETYTDGTTHTAKALYKE